MGKIAGHIVVVTNHSSTQLSGRPTEKRLSFVSPSHLEKGRCKTLQNAPLLRFSSAEVIIMDKYIGLIFNSSSSWILIGVSFLDVATPSLTHPHDGVAYSCGSALQTRLVVEHTSQKF